MGQAPNDTKLYPMINNTKPIQMPLFPMFLNDPTILYEYYKFKFNGKQQLAPCLHGILTTV